MEGGSVGVVGACVGMGVSVAESGAACWWMVGWVYMGLPSAEYCCGSDFGSGCWAGSERCFIRSIDQLVTSPVII